MSPHKPINTHAQVFEATLTYREAISGGDSDLHKSLQLYRTAACATLLCCASVYLLGGVLCIGAIRKGVSGVGGVGGWVGGRGTAVLQERQWGRPCLRSGPLCARLPPRHPAVACSSS